MTPKLYILCGKVGAGKSTLAKQLESQGVVRLSQDERALVKVQPFRNPDDGYRVFPESALREAEAEARKENLEIALSALREKKSVVFDDGFWRKSERDNYREIAAHNGAELVLYYLPVEPEEQWRRLQIRNRGDLSLVHFISIEEMEYLNKFFEPPVGEGEIVVSKGNEKSL